ncbi:MAG TPA: class I SAM-dependent methyltransferase [Enhygromyxa sp.]|nr:class I SAM-dependent methyltransferase [Enhygromyxa sp.]
MSLEIVPTREGYQRWAPYYDDYDNALIVLEQPIVTALLGDLAGARVADIGCGTGRHALRLAAAGASVTGVDFCGGMLDVLRSKQPPASVRLIEHDLGEPLPLGDGEFDVVLCSLVLEHLPDLRAIVAEFGRIVRPGGRVVLADFHPEMFRRGLHARFRAGDDAVKVQIEGVDHTIADYVMAIVGAGLEIVGMAEHRMDAETAARSESASKYVGEPMLLTFDLRSPG